MRQPPTTAPFSGRKPSAPAESGVSRHFAAEGRITVSDQKTDNWFGRRQMIKEQEMKRARRRVSLRRPAQTGRTEMSAHQTPNIINAPNVRSLPQM